MALLSATASAQWVEPETHVHRAVASPTTSDLFGWTVSAIGDIDQDGVDDFVVSAPFATGAGGAGSAGRVELRSGADGAVLWSRKESLFSSILGYSLEVVDWDGDGTNDVLAGAPFHGPLGGHVRIFNGKDGANIPRINPSNVVDDGFGAAIAVGGDYDGNGVEDVLIGSIGYDGPGGSSSGRVYVYEVGTGLLLQTIDGPAEDAEFGIGLAFLGDISSPPDGRDEIVVGHRDETFWGGEASVYRYGATGATEVYSVTGVGMGHNLIGDRIDAGKDVDGDGWPDFLVGDLFAEEVRVFSGRTGALHLTLTGDGPGGGFGAARFIDDLDEDGAADLLVGASRNSTGATDAGKIFLYSGRTGAVHKTLTSDRQGRRCGADVRPLGDFNRDGSPDFIVGAYGGGFQGKPNGRAFLLSGHLPGAPNERLPAELALDPALADGGGDPTTGPLIGSPIETFRFTLDCSARSAPGPYGILVYRNALPLPTLTALGHLWVGTPKLASFSGMHAQDVVATSAGGQVIPDDPALVGFRYTVQGFCGGGGIRISNAFTQSIDE